MERSQINGRISPSTSADISAAKSTATSTQPNYSSRAVQEALEHLASVDLIDLCSEAKVEQCRATRDLRSCGRDVQYVLVSCGHASLCSECSQRCDLCPICRTSIPKSGNKLRLRLYYECVEAGLISKKCCEQGQEIGSDNQLTVDIQRLYSLFDIALQNNLASLICHYITDVCMDDFAVSSDPVTAFMLDEVVVKDWCKQAFRNILLELQGIYNLGVEDMKTKLGNLLKLTVLLNGIFRVAEVLESLFKGNLSAQLLDLQLLQENILKTKQHLEIMTWCARFKFLEDEGSRYPDFASWSSAVRDRKSAAIKRSWPDALNPNAQPNKQGGSLFIEDALTNIEEEQGQGKEVDEEVNLAVLQRERERFYRCKIEGVSGCYPFNSLRAAVDILFLHGNSDLVVAKQAILLYYLFDRHWTLPDDTWRHIIDNFAATFGITRHSLLESLTFYLLDDHTDQALQEACNLLPEISGPTTHPKIAEVLLERGLPENALMVLRWSGRDGSQTVSLSEAVTAVRVRVECGLLTESFMHQRMLCCKVREKKLRGGLGGDASDDFRGECQTWEKWVETLVTEICYVSIKDNLVDRMIELPWNSDEEKHIHKCFFDCAIHKPSTTIGSLLVVFYLQRYRYVEAYKVDLELKRLEQDYLSKNVVSEEVSSRMQSVCQWREGLVAKSIELLPPFQQHLVKTGKLLPEISDASSGHEVLTTAKFDSPLLQKPKLNSLLLSSAVDSSVPQKNLVSASKQSINEALVEFGDSVKSPLLVSAYGSPLVPRERLFTTAERRVGPQGNIPMELNHNISSSPGSHRDGIPNVSLFKDISRTLKAESKHTGSRFRKVLPEFEQNGFIKQLQNSSPPSSKGVVTNSVAISGRRHGLSSEFNRSSSPKLSAERQNSYELNRNSNLIHRDDPMEFSRSGREKDFEINDREFKSGLLWRSDETSDEEEEFRLGKTGVTPNTNQRRRRLARKRYDL